MKYKTVWLIIIFVLSSFVVTFAENSIKAEVDKTRQSSNMSFVKNNIQRNIVYIFILAPTTVGNFKIGPATIKIGNATYNTDTFEIEVKPTLPGKPLPESDQPQITL